MYTAITVRQVLQSKGQGFWWIGPTAMAFDALGVMAEKNVGALLVMERGKLVGIFSERDYARKVILQGKSSRSTSVGELMSGNPICAKPDMSLPECMVLMANHQIRHLPVLENGAVIGMLSNRDVVHAIIAAQEHTIEQLENYVSGNDYTARLAVR